MKKAGTEGTHSQFLVFGQSDELQNAVCFVKIVPYPATQKPGMVTQYKWYRIPSICTSRTCGMALGGYAMLSCNNLFLLNSASPDTYKATVSLKDLGEESSTPL